jgi:hypothetical protein
VVLLPSAGLVHFFTQQLKRAATHHKRGEDGAIPSAATNFAPVAQLSERRASNAVVAGEIPAGSTNYEKSARHVCEDLAGEFD